MKKGGYQIERERAMREKGKEVYEIERGHYGMVCHTLEVGQLVRWWTRWLSHWLSGLGVGGQWFQSAAGEGGCYDNMLYDTDLRCEV